MISNNPTHFNTFFRKENPKELKLFGVILLKEQENESNNDQQCNDYNRQDHQQCRNNHGCYIVLFQTAVGINLVTQVLFCFGIRFL